MGTSLGIIRVFGLEEEELRPIIVKDLQGVRVTCIDVSKNAGHLIAGYANGRILLWDLQKATSDCLLNSVHDRTVLNVKFLKGTKLRVISSDVGGLVYITEFKKVVFITMGNSTKVLRNRIGFAIVPLCQSALYPNAADPLGLLAIGSVNNIVVAAADHDFRVLWELRRHPQIKKGIPYVDWGRGVLPERGENEAGGLVLALAWDRVIQLVEVPSSAADADGYVLNGYYESEAEVQSLRWLAESVIIILTSRNELRLLYTGNFRPGRYPAEDASPRQGSPKAAERGQLDVPDLEPPHRLDEELCMQIYSIGKANSAEQQTKNSYHQTVVLDGRQLIGLGKSTVIVGKLLTWYEYLNYQREKPDWLDALRFGLEIYLARLKGFAGFSESKTVRAADMSSYLKNLIRDGLLQRLPKPNAPVANPPADSLTQIQVAIEFCLGVSECDYLFTELFSLLVERNLESAFIESLEPYILSSRLRAVPVPQNMLNRMIAHYIGIGRTDTLEKVILFLNLQGQDLDSLSNVCLGCKMFSALIYAKTLQGIDYHYMEPALYMHNEMKALMRDRHDIDMQLIGSPNFDRSAVARSYNYLGYKILWYIRLCFKGDRFPHHQGDERIPQAMWPNIVYVLLNWMFIEHDKATNLQQLMQLDVDAVFQVLGLLFEDPSLRGFIMEPQRFGSKECAGLGYRELIQKLASVAESANTTGTRALHYYNTFLARVSSQRGTTISPELCARTAAYLCGKAAAEAEWDEYEEIVLKMMKNCPDLSVDQINSIIKEAQNSPYTEVLVYLLQLKGDYLKGVETYLGLTDAKRKTRIFDWLTGVHENLPESTPNHDFVQKLIYELVEKFVLFSPYQNDA